MPDHLSADSLMAHVRALADGIGPRPAGHPEEAAAREYIRGVLGALGLPDPEEIPFYTTDTWGYGTIGPVVLAMGGNLLGRSRIARLLGGLAALAGAALFYQVAAGYRQSVLVALPIRPSATLVARIAPSGEVRRRLVLIGHTDTNKHRPTFAPEAKQSMVPKATAGWAAMIVNGIAQIAQARGAGCLAEWVRRLTLIGMGGGLLTLLNDERGGYIDGANDNATAVACLLGLGAHLVEHPLEHTEVWLAFTGAEEVGCLGTHALLDAHGDDLRDAWFLDFEMVGAREIAYVTQHSGLLMGAGYTPDQESLAWADRTAVQHPDLGVRGRPMVIVEEVGSLRRRGYRGLCLVGVGEDGWLANWHQYSDNTANIQPEGVARAARFAWAMMQTLDGG